MKLEIRKLQRELEVTSVYVTHDQVEAMTLGDRLMVLNHGHVEQFGTPIELYEHPESLFVAEFIGSPAMNILKGVATNGAIELNNGSRLQSNTSANGPVSVGIRPEHLNLDPSGELALQVGMTEQLGSSTLVHGTLQNSASTLSLALPGVHREAELANTLQLTAGAENIHVFSQQGKRVKA